MKEERMPTDEPIPAKPERDAQPSGRENQWTCPRAGGARGRGRLRQSLVETALLTSLARGSAHGYRLIEMAEEMVGSQTCVDPGSVYRVLRALEEAGCVESAWEPQASGPSRRTYRLTKQGRAMLNEWADLLERRARAFGALAEAARAALDKGTAHLPSGGDTEGGTRGQEEAAPHS